MRNLVKQVESKNGKYRISIDHDEYAESPCTNWDLGATYLFEYNDHYGSSHCLHDDCSWREVYDPKWDSNKHSLADAVRSLIGDYVNTKDIVKYINEHTDDYRMRYDRSQHMWLLEQWWRASWKDEHEWVEIREFEPYDLKNYNCAYELTEDLEQDVLIDILRTCGKDIYVKESTLTGYCQGDSVDVFAYCTKEMLEKRSGRNEKAYKTWQEQADAIMESEIECINRWMWGDVYGYTLEERKNFAKTYEDGTTVDDFEWEEVDSCCGYFEDPDDIIKEILSDYGTEAA